MNKLFCRVAQSLKNYRASKLEMPGCLSITKTDNVTQDWINKQIKKGRTIIVSENSVYDVTDFLPQHPPGGNVISKHTGNDVSNSYKHHSTRARKVWSKYMVGRIRQ